MPWSRVLNLAFWVICTAAIRSIHGASLNYQPLAASVYGKPPDIGPCQPFDESSCTWCCFPCLTRRAATDKTINTSMISSSGGNAATHSKLFMQPQLRSIHPTSGLSRHGALRPTLNWLMFYGSLPHYVASAAVRQPWTHLMSQALSTWPKPRLQPVARLCLGKHLRPRKLRPQARFRPRHKRSRQRNHAWHPQVVSRLQAARDCWLLLLAQCAHQLQGSYRVLLLQVVVPLMQSAVTRSVSTQAPRNSSTKLIPASLHSIRGASPGPYVTGLDQIRTPPALPARPLRFRPLRVNRTSCLHLPTARLGSPPSRLLLRLPCSATMDLLRDPLHDSVLDEALADDGLPPATTTAMATTSALDEGTAEAEVDRASEAGSALFTLTAAMEEADRSPSTDRGPGPHGPPPAVPVRHPLARLYIPGLTSEMSVRPPIQLQGPQGTARGPRPATTTTASSSSCARGPPTTPNMPGEPDDPYWQRVVGVNVLNTLQHTGPAFVHAPTLAAVRSWGALRIILEEATEMDEICCQRIDPQDLNSSLHLPGPHGTGTDLDHEQEEAEEEQPEGEEEEAADNESSPDDHDSDAPDAPDDPDGSTGPSVVGLTATLVDSGSGGSGGGSGAAGLDLDPTDPLNHAGSGTTLTAALPSSVMPGDMIYEVDDVSFNLSAASRCLLSTRQEVARMRAGNRHRRPNGAAESSRSRSRTPPRGSGDAARQGLGNNRPDPHSLSTIPAWSRLSGETPFLPLLRHICQVVQSARRPNALPQNDRKRSLAVSVCTALVDVAQPTAILPYSESTGPRLLCSQPCRYTCAVAFQPALQAWLMLAVWFTLLVRPLFQLLPAVCPRQQRLCSACQSASLASTSDGDLALMPQTAVSNSPRSLGAQVLPQASPATHSTSRLGPNSQGPLALHMRLLVLLICLQPSCAGQWTEARVATHAAEVAGGAHHVTSNLLASAPKPGGFPTRNRPMLNACYTRAAKRAYQRACNRAVRQGQTRYRGRLLTSAQVPAARRSTQPFATPNAPTRRPGHHQTGGVQLFTSNSGGLGGGVYDELPTYLTNSHVDVAVVQESKWTTCMEYTSGPWTCVHTGCKSRKQAGVLVMVHTRLALPSQIRFEHLVKGRLIHVRVPLKTSDHRHLHVLGVYQKTHENNDKTTPQQRQQLWQAIHKCLGQLPVRDSVVLIGDLNTPLRPMEPWVGKAVGAQPANPPDDVGELETILQAHSLVALNTWYPASGGSHTF